VAAAVGYLKTDELHFEKDPDRRVQEAIALVFRKFGELGTVRQTLWWFLEHGLQLPVRPASGELVWRRPSYGMLYRMLSNPMYGGAYTMSAVVRRTPTTRAPEVLVTSRRFAAPPPLLTASRPPCWRSGRVTHQWSVEVNAPRRSGSPTLGCGQGQRKGSV
jgi:hypothetical protein